MQVTSVDTSGLSKSGGAAIVVASLEESAQLYDRDGQQADSYSRSTYEAQYSMVQLRDGSWRLSKVVVLGGDKQ